jgi:hypothetical protein
LRWAKIVGSVCLCGSKEGCDVIGGILQMVLSNIARLNVQLRLRLAEQGDDSGWGME